MEIDRAKILWDFQIQTDKQLMANQPDIVVVDKQQKIGSDHNTKKNEHEKLKKYQGLMEEVEKMWEVKATVHIYIYIYIRLN